MYAFEPVFSLKMASVGQNMEEKLLQLNTWLLMNIYVQSVGINILFVM